MNKQNLKSLLEKTLEEIKPKKEDVQRINHIAKEFSKLLKKEKIKFLFGGSFAKGTFLKSIEDIECLFINEEEVGILKNKLSKIFSDLRILHGSRDYFQVDFKGITFEMVPILDIEDVKEARNSTDLSKFHVEYVKKTDKRTS